MTELVLTYTDAEGAERKLAVETDRFIIGRHSSCDLTVVDSRLSRDHVKIERDGGDFTVCDVGSTNGTTLNGQSLYEEEVLKNEDILDLGNGGIVLTALITRSETEEEQAADSAVPQQNPPSSAATAAPGINPIFVLSAVVGIFLLVAIGLGAVLLIGTGKTAKTETVESSDSGLRDTDYESDPTPSAESTPPAGQTPETVPSATIADGSDTSNPGSETGDSQSSSGSPVDKKTEALVYSFMRRIATNDKRPYLTTKRFEEVSARIQRLKVAPGLAANIRSAASNSGEIRSIAASKSLKPQLLAAAALAKLGGQQGNVSATASEMANVLGRLTIVLSNELADDSLLVIAAYNEGVEGRDLAMRDRLAVFAKKNPTATPREIRTIWFMKENGGITSSQYEFVLNFLAIGTITQNPKEFGVNSEALILD